MTIEPAQDVSIQEGTEESGDAQVATKLDDDDEKLREPAAEAASTMSGEATGAILPKETNETILIVNPEEENHKDNPVEPLAEAVEGQPVLQSDSIAATSQSPQSEVLVQSYITNGT